MRLAVGLAAFVATTEGTTCDLFDKDPATKCVAAHSTVRALYRSYAGALYQVRRKSDNTTMDVKVTAAGGFADSAAQDKFCSGTDCHIWRIYDQSPKLNHLDIAPPGGAHRAEDAPVNATAEALTVGGHKVYAAYFEGGMGCKASSLPPTHIHGLRSLLSLTPRSMSCGRPHRQRQRHCQGQRARDTLRSFRWQALQWGLLL